MKNKKEVLTHTNTNTEEAIKQNYKFIWDKDNNICTLEERLAKEYYDKLYKEYCIANLSRYKEGK